MTVPPLLIAGLLLLLGSERALSAVSRILFSLAGIVLFVAYIYENV